MTEGIKNGPIGVCQASGRSANIYAGRGRSSKGVLCLQAGTAAHQARSVHQRAYRTIGIRYSRGLGNSADATERIFGYPKIKEPGKYGVSPREQYHITAPRYAMREIMQ